MVLVKYVEKTESEKILLLKSSEKTEKPAVTQSVTETLC